MTVTELLNALDVESRGAGEHHHARRGWRQLDCPQCSPNSGRFLCGIHESSLACSCWQCSRLRLGDTLAEASGRPLREVLALLATFDGPGIAQDGPEPVRGKYLPPDGLMPLDAKRCGLWRQYLTARGLDWRKCAEMYGLMAIVPPHKYQFRLFLPVLVAGKPVSWTTRAIGEVGVNGLRYVSAPPERESVPLKATLFGRDLAKGRVVVVEGCFGAVAVGPGCVGTYGLSVTRAQVLLISKYAERVVCFDNEPAAQARARKLAQELSAFSGITRVANLSGADPDTSPPDELAELRSRFLE